MLPKQVAQVFFGATDQDTSKKGIKLGDLVQAVNCQQVKGGELTKREGFTATAQTYEGLASIDGESVISPNGFQVITRDATTDTVFARSTDATHNQNVGQSLRILAKTQVRFQALETGTQISPMAKQAGDFYVYLKDASTFVVAKRSTNSETLLISREFSVSFGSPEPSTHVSSFAVIDNADFDATSFWIFWVDWTTNATAQQNRDAVRAVKITHDLGASTFYTLDTGTQTNNVYTSICASVTSDNYVTIGVSTAHAITTPDNYTAFWDFRKDGPPVNTGIAVLKYDATPSLKFSYTGERAGTYPNWTASGISSLTSSENTFHTGHCRFALWVSTQASLNSCELVMVDVDVANTSATWTTIETITDAGHWPITATQGRPLFMGSTTGMETAAGTFVAAQMRIYYHNTDNVTFVDPTGDVGLYPDRIFTKGYAIGDITGLPSLLWTARGAWLASGWFMSEEGIPLLVTGWQDNGAAQVPYHLRRFDTGAILAQFAYGEGPFAGGCANPGTQIDNHVCDINQPAMQSTADSRDAIVLAIQSANIAGSVDVSNITISRPTYQGPVAFRDLAVYPGPIPTIANGWQNLQEAGPLVYPSQMKCFWGSGSS
jgi:hypothetical protein